MIVYQIDIGYACFGIVDDDGVIAEAAPIAKWTVKKKTEYVLNYYRTKGAVIKLEKEVE